jgi:ATP-dependent protease ClpP protease subunit
MEGLGMSPLIKDNEGSVFNDYVPIIEKGNHYDVYLNNTINYPDFYTELVDLLGNLESYNTVTLHINNGGGSIDSAFMVIDAIQNCEAPVTAKLSGTVASASTVITLACDEIIVSKYVSFMIHNYSTGMQGKGHELKAYQTFTDKELNRAFKAIYKDFLTAKEMNEVIEGRDIWLNEEEVLKRWSNIKDK